jgi:hypothetical protein
MPEESLITDETIHDFQGYIIFCVEPSYPLSSLEK